MKVLLLAGGDSSEREVSLNSGSAVFNALKRIGHTVYAIDPASGKSLLTSDSKFITKSIAASSGASAANPTGAMTLAKTIGSPAFRDIDVVFLALHGGGGENGSIQNLLELARKPYTGSNMAASAIAMNKAVSKRLFSSEGILTPHWKLYQFKSENIDEKIISDIQKEFDFPIIVKPNDSGSTIGLTVVKDVSDLKDALKTAIDESYNVLVENYIEGREITVPILNGEALPVIEIIAESGLYDYEAKYTKGKSEYIVPAKISKALAEDVQKAAVSTYEIIGAAGLARVDFILDKNNKFYCLELNTLPGMTELSLAPMAAKEKGIDFDKLVEMLVESALDPTK